MKRKANNYKTMMKTLKSLHNFREKMDIEKQRKSQETLGRLFSTTKEITWETLYIDNLPAQWVYKNKTNNTKNVILYFHGGAYITGNLTYARILATKLAFNTELNVLSIDYRLAPENPYPCALEDAIKAWDYLLSKGYSNENIALVGESAGGNLVLALVHYLKLNRRSLPKSIVCMSPWIDLTHTGKSHETKKNIDPMLTTKFLSDSAKMYVDENDLTSLLVSPIYGDFSNFPKTFIQVGSNEILLSDSLTMKNKLIAEHCDCTLEVWKGMWHVFQMFPLKKSNKAIKNISIFLTATFADE